MIHPVARAGGLIDGSWTFEKYSSVLESIPRLEQESDMLRPQLVLSQDSKFSVYYCPFDHINLQARIVLIGITPGLQQAFLSNQAAQRALLAGCTLEEAQVAAERTGSFAGPMRRNLVAMLDGIGVSQYLGVASTETMFLADANLYHTTSAIVYPAFIRKASGTLENYGGHPDPMAHPLLREFITRVLVDELEMVPDAKIVPLGKAVSQILMSQASAGRLDAKRCLFDFPHPSGQNGHRVKEYAAHRASMTERVASWA